MTDKQREALEEIDQCFEAALAEGWIEALADGDIYRIRDIANRRLFYARGIAQQAAQQPAQAEPTSKVAEYQAALEKGLALICAAVGLENEHYDDDSKTDVENYLDCFKDAANWLEHAGVYWDRDAGCVVLSRPPRAVPDDVVRFMQDALPSLISSCGNSYVNAWLQYHLEVARKYGVWTGPVTGDILEIIDIEDDHITTP